MTIFSKLHIFPSQKHLFNTCARLKPAFLQTSNCWFSQKPSHTYYEILGLHQGATAQEIRNAFLKLSKQYHPDVTQNDIENHSRFLKINEAYSVLSKPNTRTEYNSSLLNESLRRESFEGAIRRSETNTFEINQARKHNDAHFPGKAIFQNAQFSDGSGGKQDRNDSSISEMFTYSVYTVAASLIIAFCIMSATDIGPNNLTKNPYHNNAYISKEELERGQLLWKADESGRTVYYYAVDSESNDQNVYVACREKGDKSTEYVYRVLATYNRSSTKKTID